ncbi:MAG: sugar phosphate isomerase/epimerase family protein [Acidimicrobiales bacterium]
MYTFSDFGLCCGSIASADFRTLAESAGDAGFGSITLWPSVFERALADGLTAADMRSILDANGLVVTELDPLCTWLPITLDPGDIAARFYSYDEAVFFRMADELGARNLNVIQATDDPIDPTAVVDALGALAERAEHHGLLVSVEFLPWSPIRDLATALALVGDVGTNVGVNIDIWHHLRSGGTVEDLEALDATTIAAVQINDVAPEAWEDPLRETAVARRLPGEGSSNTAAILTALYGAGIRVPLNVEVFSRDLQRLDSPAAALRIADSIRSLTG